MTRSLFVAAALLLVPALAHAEATGEIDWQRRVIKARGQGAPDLNAPSVSAARLGAERAARADAMRNLLETLKGAELTTGARVGTLLQNDNATLVKVNGVLRGFKMVKPHYFNDGGVAYDAEVPLDRLPPELVKDLKAPGSSIESKPDGGSAAGAKSEGKGAHKAAKPEAKGDDESSTKAAPKAAPDDDKGAGEDRDNDNDQ